MPRTIVEQETKRAGISRHSLGFVIGSIVVVVITYWVLQACAAQPEANAATLCREAPALTTLPQALASLDATEIRSAVSTLQKIQLAAPSEVADQVAVLRSVTTDLADATASNTASSEDAARSVWRAHEGDLSRIETAAREVAVYIHATCGLDVTSTLSPDNRTGANTEPQSH
ncbi:MAG: hypothetical protein N2037_07485 [Acidimicrobiales bacterium]|nr:hypothetical protein [Acidimicrobiales bacterium]